MNATLTELCAIIPVKAFAQAKQRLSPMLKPSQRRALAYAMLQDVLAATTQVGFGRVAIVTADDAATRLAASAGAHVIWETAGHGLNAAVETALRDEAMPAFRGAVVIPSDIPEATPDNLIAALMGFDTARGITIVPSRDGGTNLLACTPHDAIAPSFGPESCARHVAAARAAGLAVRTVDIPALARDIDTPDDLRAFVALETNTRTHDYLLPVMRGLDPRIHHHDKAFLSDGSPGQARR